MADITRETYRGQWQRRLPSANQREPFSCVNTNTNEDRVRGRARGAGIAIRKAACGGMVSSAWKKARRADAREKNRPDWKARYSRGRNSIVQ